MLQTLKRYQTQLVDDPIIKSHLKSLYDNLLEQNLCRIIEPFSRVQVEHVAKLVGLDVVSLPCFLLSGMSHFIPAATEALKQWYGGRAPKGRGLVRGLAVNIGASLCNLVHFSVKICILITIIQTSCRQKWHRISMLFHATFTVHAIYVPQPQFYISRLIGLIHRGDIVFTMQCNCCSLCYWSVKVLPQQLPRVSFW